MIRRASCSTDVGKIISSRKKVETRNRNLIIILNARRENRTGRSSKRETNTGKFGVGESGIQLPVTTVGSMG